MTKHLAVVLLVAVASVCGGRSLAQEAKLRTTLEGHTLVVSSVAFSPDGKLLAVGCGDENIRLRDVKTGEGNKLRGHKGEVTSVAFSPDGKLLASGSQDKTIKLWEILPIKKEDK